MRVRSPLGRADEDAAELLLGNEQGYLLTLLGSDSPSLRAGNEALDLLIDEHGDHPLALYAHFVKGINAGRSFKTIAGRKVHARAVDLATSVEHLDAAFRMTADPKIDTALDNITLGMTMRHLADSHVRAGDKSGAKEVIRNMRAHFKGKQLPAHVTQEIEASTVSYDA